MLDKNQINDLLEQIGNKVESEVIIYLLGGGNLSLKNLKDVTKDIDLVVENKNIFDIFVNAIKKLGYKHSTANPDFVVYNEAVIVFLDESEPDKTKQSRIDIFIKTVARMLELSEGMKERSSPYKQFGKLKGNLWEQIELPFFLKKNNNPLLINFTGIGPVMYKNKLTYIYDLSFK